MVPLCGLYVGSYSVVPEGTTMEPMGRAYWRKVVFNLAHSEQGVNR